MTKPRQGFRVLFVADSLYWVTATIAREIAAHNPWIEPTICSEGVVRSLLEQGVDLPGRVDIAHFLTPHIGTRLLSTFRDRTPCITSIYHVEDERSVEAEPASDAIMTICRQWHDHLVAIGADAEKIVMLPMGINIEMFRPARRDEKTRQRKKLGIPTDAVVVGFSAKKSSNTYNRKGSDTLVQAIAELSHRRPDVVLVMIGPGWGEVVEQQTRLGVQCIHLPFLLEQEDVARVHRCLDIFWVTARIEGGPVPLLEAMSSGTCCVTTPVGVAPELIFDETNGFLVGFDDVQAIVDRTERLVIDATLRSRMGALARQTIVDRCRWEQTALAARPLYEVALSRFQKRQPSSGNKQLPPTSLSPAASVGHLHAVPPELRSQVSASEHRVFMDQLLSMGERRAAMRVGFRALAACPQSRSVWRSVVRSTPLLPMKNLRESVRKRLRKVSGNTLHNSI
ncbi:glycosyltransferase family 4 protein [Tautonia marina]|uniref:glycosyltransferase family 4 protein n=1 Tax=Tautonia marina TaxID=2653855 RepID=UPI001260D169|nr:glycosyltransferase family 4 protein [Tautonia marina]